MGLHFVSVLLSLGPGNSFRVGNAFNAGMSRRDTDWGHQALRFFPGGPGLSLGKEARFQSTSSKTGYKMFGFPRTCLAGEPGGQKIGSRDSLLSLESCICHPSTGWPWSDHFTCLCFSFFSWNMKMITATYFCELLRGLNK